MSDFEFFVSHDEPYAADFSLLTGDAHADISLGTAEQMQVEPAILAGKTLTIFGEVEPGDGKTVLYQGFEVTMVEKDGPGITLTGRVAGSTVTHRVGDHDFFTTVDKKNGWGLVDGNFTAVWHTEE